MAQSSNDTFPTASHIAVVTAADRLLTILDSLAEAFRHKGAEFMSIPKSGRAHLMDAMPVKLGHEFRAYGTAVERAAGRIRQRRDDLLEIPLGSTATGTGTGAHPAYRKTVLAKLSELTSLELIRIANDLRLLSSGPTTGIAEIELPSVQPGSSIMPGKVNPVMAECLDMVAFQVVGNDTAVALAAQLELNVMTPVMTYNALHSIEMLGCCLPVFIERCVKGIAADEGRCRSYLDLNPSLATLLSSRIGYLKAAELATEALERKIPVPDLVVEKGLLSPEEARQIFDPDTMSDSTHD